MARFQAQTNAVLDHELEDLRRRLGLGPNQKADLLREAAAIAGWVVRQAEAGRSVEARRGKEVERLLHPALERLRSRPGHVKGSRISLSDDEAERLARVLDRGFSPTPALRSALRNLASPRRRPPNLRWKRPAA